MNNRLIVLLLVLIVLVAFGGIVSADFVNMDDGWYVTDNVHVRDGLSWENVVWAFTSLNVNWHPLTWISHMLDCELFHLNPAGHHATNLLLHLSNTLLLFFALQSMTGASLRSGIVAALFAVHPQHVESVAWVAERKDMLGGLFWLLTLIAYVSYARDSSSRRKYATVCLLYALGLLTKPMLVTLPMILLLVDYWPLGRVGESKKILIGEKIPLFVMAGASAVITCLAQSAGGAVRSFEHFPLLLRIENAIWSVMMYLVKMFWPLRLAVFYPHSGDALHPGAIGAVALCIVMVTGAALLCARKYPYGFTGWFWYLITLIPVIGLVQVGNQAMADRYTYIPSIGIFITLVWVGFAAMQRWPAAKRVGVVAATAILFTLIVLTRVQAGYWQNSVTLFKHTLAVTKNNEVAHNNLGNALLEQGDCDGAIAQFAEAIRIRPDNFWAHNNAGYVLLSQGKCAEAMPYFRRSLDLQPNDPKVLRNLAYALAGNGNSAEAIRILQDRMVSTPRDARLCLDMAIFLGREGRVEEARVYLAKAEQGDSTMSGEIQSIREALKEKESHGADAQ